MICEYICERLQISMDLILQRCNFENMKVTELSSDILRKCYNEFIIFIQSDLQFKKHHFILF